jgi:hypothetical protein
LKKDTLWRSIIALLLGFSTVILIQFVVTLLPNGQIRDLLSGIVSVPASLVTTIIFPDGKPAGGQNVAWDLILTVAKISLCSIVWYAVLAWRNRKSQSAVI